MTAPAAAPAMEECPRCEGAGQTVCCTAFDVGESGPRGCRCPARSRGYRTCDRCSGEGEVPRKRDEDEEASA